MSTSEQQLRAGADALGIAVTDAEFTALLGYLSLLQKWNKAYNLTAIRDESGMVALHLLDSLAVHPAVGADRVDRCRDADPQGSEDGAGEAGQEGLG